MTGGIRGEKTLPAIEQIPLAAFVPPQRTARQHRDVPSASGGRPFSTEVTFFVESH